MELIKPFMAAVAMVLPLSVCVLLGWRMIRNRNTDWKLATCLSGSAIATALVLLLGSEKLMFLKYGDAVLQVNEKAEETRRLTEQNKRIAVKTAKAIVCGLEGAITDETHNDAGFYRDIKELLKEAGTPNDEINQLLGHTNAVQKTP